MAHFAPSSLRDRARRLIARFAAPAFALGVVATTLPAVGYERSQLGPERRPARWQPATIELSVDAASIPDGIGGADALKALRAAAASWSAPACTAASIRIVEGRAAAGSGRDGVSSIAFLRRAWCQNDVKRAGRCYDPRLAAVSTARLALKQQPAGEPRIDEVDIEINAVNFAFSTADRTAAASALLDLQSVAVHELGHALGFDHVCGRRTASGPSLRCDRAPPEAAASVMFPVAPGTAAAMPRLRRDLGADDVRAVCEVYPAVTLGGHRTPP